MNSGDFLRFLNSDGVSGRLLASGGRFLPVLFTDCVLVHVKDFTILRARKMSDPLKEAIKYYMEKNPL